MLLPLLTERFSNSINFADLQTGSHPGPLKEPFGACARVELPQPPLRGAGRAGLRAVPGEGDRAARGPVEVTRTQISSPSQFSPTEVAPEDGKEAGEPGPGLSRLLPERCAVFLQQDGQGPAFRTSAASLQVDPEPARPPGAIKAKPGPRRGMEGGSMKGPIWRGGGLLSGAMSELKLGGRGASWGWRTGRGRLRSERGQEALSLSEAERGPDLITASTCHPCRTASEETHEEGRKT